MEKVKNDEREIKLAQRKRAAYDQLEKLWGRAVAIKELIQNDEMALELTEEFVAYMQKNLPCNIR